MKNVGRWISKFQDMWKDDKKPIEEGRVKVSAFMPSRGYFTSSWPLGECSSSVAYSRDMNSHDLDSNLMTFDSTKSKQT